MMCIPIWFSKELRTLMMKFYSTGNLFRCTGKVMMAKQRLWNCTGCDEHKQVKSAASSDETATVTDPKVSKPRKE